MTETLKASKNQQTKLRDTPDILVNNNGRVIYGYDCSRHSDTTHPHLFVQVLSERERERERLGTEANERIFNQFYVGVFAP